MTKRDPLNAGNAASGFNKLFSPQEMKTITSTRIKGTKLKNFYHVIMRKQEIKTAFGSWIKTVIYGGFFVCFFNQRLSV